MQKHKLLLGLMGLGLATMNVAQVATQTRLKDPPAAYTLAGKGTVTLDEALPGVHYIVIRLTPEGRARAHAVDGPRFEADFNKVCTDLEHLGIIPSSWRTQRRAYLTRGKLAYMVCSILKIRPGLLTGLFGMSERYALRELSHRELMAGGPTSAYVTGAELVSVLSRVSMRLAKVAEPTIEESEYH